MDFQREERSLILRPIARRLGELAPDTNLEAIVDVCDAIMVARNDLGVEMSPEKVPLLQKQIIWSDRFS
jgi:pyruvate kinase